MPQKARKRVLSKNTKRSVKLKEKRQSETPQQTADRLEAQRQRQSRRRESETPEETQARLEMMKNRKAELRKRLKDKEIDEQCQQPRPWRKDVNNDGTKKPRKRKSKSKNWSADEKKKLLLAIKKSTTDELDYDYLERCVPTRTKKQIIILQNKLKTIPRELEKDKAKKDKDSEDATKISAPIELWTSLIRELTHYEEADYSNIISDVFSFIVDSEEDSDDPCTPNYKALYAYILACLNGQEPPQLSILDSAVIIDLMKSLADILKTSETKTQRSLVRWKYKLFKRKVDVYNLREHSERLRMAIENDFAAFNEEEKKKKQQTEQRCDREESAEPRVATVAEIPTVQEKKKKEKTGRKRKWDIPHPPIDMTPRSVPQQQQRVEYILCTPTTMGTRVSSDSQTISPSSISSNTIVTYKSMKAESISKPPITNPNESSSQITEKITKKCSSKKAVCTATDSATVADDNIDTRQTNTSTLSKPSTSTTAEMSETSSRKTSTLSKPSTSTAAEMSETSSRQTSTLSKPSASTAAEISETSSRQTSTLSKPSTSTAAEMSETSSVPGSCAPASSTPAVHGIVDTDCQVVGSINEAPLDSQTCGSSNVSSAQTDDLQEKKKSNYKVLPVKKPKLFTLNPLCIPVSLLKLPTLSKP